MNKIDFQTTPRELVTIEMIANRAMADLLVARRADKFTKQDIMMDVSAVHCNGNPLRLDDLLDAGPFDFAHDILGIRRHLNRDTGKANTSLFATVHKAHLIEEDTMCNRSLNNKTTGLLDFKKMERKMAIDNTLEWFDGLIDTQKRGAAQLEQRRKRFINSVEEPDGFVSPMDVISWTINDLKNTQRNFRLDLSIGLAVRLSRVL